MNPAIRLQPPPGRKSPWRLLAAFALLSALMVSCSKASGSQSGPSPSPSALHTSPTSTSTASATIATTFPVATDVTCPDLTSYGVSRYLEGPTDFNRHEVVLCDSRQLDRPLALHALDAVAPLGFQTQNVIVFLESSGNGPSNASSAIKTLDLASQQVKTLASSTGGFMDGVGWSHDQSSVAFITDTGDSHHFWLKRGSNQASELTSQIQLFGRGGIEGDEGLVAFSQDDQYVVFVDTAVYRLQVFRTSDGGVAYTAPSGQGGLRTMAAWAHFKDQMYFRNDSGVFRWDPTSGISSFAPGVKWENPLFSPDDRHLAYTVWDSAGTSHIVIRDMSTGTTSSSPPLRLSSAFLSNNFLFEQVTKLCDNTGPCGPFDRTQSYRSLRIDTGAEAELPMPAGWGLDVFLAGH